MKEVFSTIFILVLFISGYAQKGTIRGFVYEEETGEPVIFTNVYLKNTTLGSTTNDNGYFSITDIPPGNYDLMITAMGYKNLQEAVTVNPGDMQTRKFFVNTASYEIEGVDVTADRSEAKTETKTSVAKLTPTDIQRIPSVGGQADIAQYMQVLPGVVFTGDRADRLLHQGRGANSE
ncbi:MAG: carboxypeptidase-like regulatory domain-containing protein [Bacteroidales bacterium]|nr:carboxypeptidase-like regulatory domain-containing protein [Bacteroidales bacterium]